MDTKTSYMIKGRLIASGCSYTEYCWSTWADILGMEFEHFRRVGTAGADNAIIARSVVHNAQAGDTVVVMWSSYDRWSFYLEEGYPMPHDPNNHWRHLGSLALFDEYFYTNYYHRVERFSNTMDCIQLVDLHSKVNNYTAYHFVSFPLFLAETEGTVDPRIVEIYDRYKNQFSNNYLLETSLEEFKIQNYNILTEHKYGCGDTHPTPLCHWEYAEKIICPKLGISLNTDNKSSIIKEQNDLINHGITIR